MTDPASPNRQPLATAPRDGTLVPPQDSTAAMCPHCESVLANPAAAQCNVCLKPLRPGGMGPTLRLSFPTGELKVTAGQQLILGRDAGQSPAASTFTQYDNVSRKHATVWVDQGGVAKVRDELLENKAVKRWLDGLWEQGRTALLKAARNPDTMLAGRIGELVTQFGAMLGEDAAIKRTLNRYARRAVVGMVDSYGETALKLVSDTIRGWDAKTITDRLENAVGDDLQYIRINGTLVGGLVGVAIHAVDILI